MTDTPIITSASNPLIKELARLSTRRGRDATSTFLVEGRREVDRAVASGLEIDLFLICEELAVPPPPPRPPAAIVQRLGEAAYRKISRRQRPDGVAVRARMPALGLDSIDVPPNALVLVSEGIEKPGNLGAMVRTAAALSVDAVIVADPVTDIFNPNTIRASQGALFNVPLAVGSSTAVDAWLRNNGIAVIAGHPVSGTPPWEVDLRGPVAIVVGSEARGLSATWLDKAVLVTVPMADGQGSDSLNAATAAALLIYEAGRQRTSG